MFSLICAWINGWVNKREAGDLRRHGAHYDVIVVNTTDSRYPEPLIWRSGIYRKKIYGCMIIKWVKVTWLHIIAQVYKLSAVHCQVTRYFQRVPGYLTRYSQCQPVKSLLTKISQSDCVFQLMLGLEEHYSPSPLGDFNRLFEGLIRVLFKLWHFNMIYFLNGINLAQKNVNLYHWFADKRKVNAVSTSQLKSKQTWFPWCLIPIGTIQHLNTHLQCLPTALYW